MGGRAARNHAGGAETDQGCADVAGAGGQGHVRLRDADSGGRTQRGGEGDVEAGGVDGQSAVEVRRANLIIDGTIKHGVERRALDGRGQEIREVIAGLERAAGAGEVDEGVVGGRHRGCQVRAGAQRSLGQVDEGLGPRGTPSRGRITDLNRLVACLHRATRNVQRTNHVAGSAVHDEGEWTRGSGVIDQAGIADGDGSIAVIEEPLRVGVVEESRASDLDDGDAETRGTARRHETVTASGNIVRPAGEVEITIPIGRGDILGARVTRGDGDGAGGLIIGIRGTAFTTLGCREKGHVGGDIDDRPSARTRRGHVQLGGSRVADDRGVDVEGASQDGQVAGDRLGSIDIKDALVDVAGTGGKNLPGEIERTRSRLREDRSANAIGDVRGEGQDSIAIDMRDKVGIHRGVALDATPGDCVSVVTLEDQSAGGQRKRVAGADVQGLSSRARLNLHLIRRPAASQRETGGEFRRIGVSGAGGRRRIKGVIREGGARRGGAGILDEVEIAVSGREDDLATRGAARSRRIIRPQPDFRIRRRGDQQGHAGRAIGHASGQGHDLEKG